VLFEKLMLRKIFCTAF